MAPASPTSASNAVRNLTPFALVGIAMVGLVVETADVDTDNARGLLLVGSGATVGLAASLVYSWLEPDVGRAERVRLAAWTVIRLSLAFAMMRYGVAKIVGMQFYRRYHLLDTRTLDMGPMALAWTFFGRTYGYQAISGAIECTAAALLCFRRTTALGACLLLTVLSNVVLVDYFYDVPVKLFASIYLAMALYVLAPDARRFWVFFFGDEPVPPRAYLAPPVTPRKKVAAAGHAALIALVLGLPAADIIHKAFQRHIFTRDALEGAWNVGLRTGLDDLLPDAAGPWDKVYFEKGDYGFIRVGKRGVPFVAHVDEPAHKLRISIPGNHGSSVLEGAFTLQDRSLRFEGVRGAAPFSVDMTREFPR